MDASRGLVDSAVALEAGRGPGWILQMQQHDIDNPNVVPACYSGFPFCKVCRALVTTWDKSTVEILNNIGAFS